MTNKFLLNLLGFNPDLTSRQSRVGSVSILSRQSDLLTYVGRIAALLLLVLTIGVGNAWGANVTFTFNTDAGLAELSITKPNSGAGTDLTANSPYTKSPISFSTTHGSTNTRVWNSSGTTSLRVYKNGSGKTNYGTLTFTSSSGNITAIALGSGTWTASTGTVTSNNSWSGNAASVTLSCTANATISTISVTYTAAATPTVTPDPTSLDWGTVLQGSSQGNKTISITGSNLTAGTLTISATGGYSVTPTSKSVSGTLAATTLTVTPPSTSTTGAKNGKVTISGGGLASAIEVNLSMTVNAASTVTWMNNSSEYTTTLVANGSKPEFPSNPSSCDGTSTSFYGWTTATWTGKLDDVSAKTIYTSAASIPNVTGAVTYYAVFAKASSSSSYKKGTSADLTEGQTVVIVNNNSSNALSSEDDGDGYLLATSVSITSNTITSPSSALIWTVELGSNGGYFFKHGSNYINAYEDNKGNHHLYFDNYTDEWMLTGSGPYVLNSTEDSGYKLYYWSTYSCWDTYTGTGNPYNTDFYVPEVTYSKYLTNCCTPLGTINGSISFTNPTTAVVSWDNIANVSSWTVKYKVHGSSWNTWDGEQTVYTKSTTNDSRKVTITGLTCNTAYDFQIIATPSSGYCDKDETLDNSGSGYNSGKWSVTYNLENVSKTSGPDAGANVCGDFTAVFAASSGSALPDKAAITVTGASEFSWTKGTGTLTISSANITGNISITMAGACTAFSLHTGNHSYGGWVSNNCFGDADWGASDDAIWEGEFPSTNACYVGWQGSTSTYGEEWAIGGIKTYDIPTGRTLGWNSGNYYESYPANALGTFHIYKNSKDKNYYLRFKPEAYVLRTGTDGSGWTSTAMTKSASNNNYYETAPLTLTSTLIDEHAYVDLKANNANGHVWCNFSSDATAENNIKVKSGYGDEDAKFRATNLADGDAGKYGKFRIDITKDVDNWKLAFVPMYKITYAAGTGASGSMEPSAYQEIGGTIAAAAEGFTDPTYKQFNGWSDGVNTYAAGADVTMTSDVTLTAQWTDIPVTALTLSASSLAKYVGEPNVTLSVSSVTPSGANPAVTWSSSNKDVATVTSGGEVAFVGAGTATITATSTITGTTKATCTVNVYSVTLVVNGDDDVALAGGGIPTMTFTASTRAISTAETGNYVFKSLTQSGGSWSTSPSTTTGTTTAVLAAATANVTVTATYYKPRTVTWNIWEDNSHVSEVKYNTEFQNISDGKPVLGTDFDNDELDACGSTKFIGWVTSSGVRTTDGGTSSLYTSNKPGATDKITTNTNYYAMFAEANGVSSTKYKRVTSASELVANQKVVVVSNGTMCGMVNAGTSFTATSAPSETDGEISAPTSNDIWTISKSGDYFIFTNNKATSMKIATQYYSSGSTLATTQNYDKWEVGTNTSSDNMFYLRLYNGSSMTNHALQYYSSSWKIYSASTPNYTTNSNLAIKFYVPATIYINYRTGCTVTCSRPTPASPTSIGKTGATISWSAGSNGTPASYDYKVWAEGDDEPVSGTNTTLTSVTLSGLYSGVTYHWKVKANCSGGDGESIWAAGSDFTTTDATLTFSVPTGATAVDPSTTATNLPEADAPTDCGDCWAFVGWTTAAYAESSSAPATLFPAGIKARVSGDATLYAVYKKEMYDWITSLSDLEADEYYILTSINASDVERAMTNTLGTGSFPHYTTSADITIKEYDDGWVLYNPSTSIIWKLSGTYSSGKLYNEAAGVYLDLSVKGEDVLKSSTSDNLVFSKANSERFDIASTTTSANYLYMFTNEDGVWGIDNDHAGFSSCYIYKRQSATYATTPSCPIYTVTWDVNNGATTSTTEVTKCEGYLSALPSAPADNTLVSCIPSDGKFVGWSANKVMPATDTRPSDLFADKEDAPEITDDITFYAVFAHETAGGEAATNKTFTFTSASWGDADGAWTSGSAGNALTSGRGIQITEAKTGANATTKASYKEVTKVTVTYCTNTNDGAGSIDIKVDGTSYTGSSSVTNSGGTSARTIDFTPPSSALDGNVKITVTCTTSSIYIKSVQIFYTGSTTTYEGYRTACCDDPQLTFGTIASPVTEYVIVREDLASASAGVEIDCNFESNNTTEAITWASTHRDANAYVGAYTWTGSQPTDRLEIDPTNKKIIAKETGSWQITIAQAMGSTNYCDETATVNIIVKTVDKFIDNVNGNFSGEAQRLEDTGNGIVLPTEETFSADNGCADGTTRRLLGWIKASDLATYASGRRVDMIDDLKTSDPATNKVIAPGTKVQATGVTWYAVWGVEK